MRNRMACIPVCGTAPERALYAAAARLGGTGAIHNDDTLSGTPDLAIHDGRVAVSAHGCCWHAHPGCPCDRVPRTAYPWAGSLLATRPATAPSGPGCSTAAGGSSGSGSAPSPGASASLSRISTPEFASSWMGAPGLQRSPAWARAHCEPSAAAGAPRVPPHPLLHPAAVARGGPAGPTGCLRGRRRLRHPAPLRRRRPLRPPVDSQDRGRGVPPEEILSVRIDNERQRNHRPACHK